MTFLIELDMGLKDLRPLFGQFQVVKPVVARVPDLFHKTFRFQLPHYLGTLCDNVTKLDVLNCALKIKYLY